MKTKINYLSGSFKDRKSAERAYNRLQEKGYTNKEIDVMMSDATHAKFFKDKEDEGLGSKIKEGIGMPEDRVKKHKKNISEGNIVVGVTPRSSADHSSIGNDWTMFDASDVY